MFRSLAAALVLLSSLWQPKVAVAQGVVSGGGNLDANFPQRIGSPNPTETLPRRAEIFDRDALEHAKTFCVDLEHMENSQATDVREFLAKESQPEKLLSKLPWQLIDDCTKADAVARIYFSEVGVYEESYRADVRTRSARFRQGSQPVLLVYDKASIRLFYRAQGQILGGKMADSLGSPFSMLIKDLKKIDRAAAKGS